MRQGLDKYRVIQVAAEIIDKEGFDQISLANLSKQLHVKTPSLYNHINGIQGLKEDLASFAMNKFKEVLTMSVVGKSGEEALYALGESYVDFARKHPGLYEATMSGVVYSTPELMETGEKIVQLLLKVLEVFNLNHVDALHMVRGLRSIAHGFVSLELKSGFNMVLNKEESLEQILKTYVAGLKVLFKNGEENQ